MEETEMAKRVWHPQSPWTLPDDTDERLLTCVAAAEAILAIEPMNRRLLTGLLDQVFWHATVHPHKLQIRWRSLEATREARLPLSRFLRHEHVFERAWLRSQLVDEGKEPAAVLPFAVACLVTVEEHARLRSVDDDLVGWQRYRAASIDVVDMRTGELVAHDELRRLHPVPA